MSDEILQRLQRLESKQPSDEALQRLRRIETRVTRMSIHMGVTTETNTPRFDPGSVRSSGGVLTIPSPHCSLKEMLDAVPPGYEGGPIEIRIGDQRLARIVKL